MRPKLQYPMDTEDQARHSLIIATLDHQHGIIDNATFVQVRAMLLRRWPNLEEHKFNGHDQQHRPKSPRMRTEDQARHSLIMATLDHQHGLIDNATFAQVRETLFRRWPEVQPKKVSRRPSRRKSPKR